MELRQDFNTKEVTVRFLHFCIQAAGNPAYCLNCDIIEGCRQAGR